MIVLISGMHTLVYMYQQKNNKWNNNDKQKGGDMAVEKKMENHHKSMAYA